VEFTEADSRTTFSEATVPQLYLRDVIFSAFRQCAADEVTMASASWCRLIGTSMTEGLLRMYFRECNLQMAALGFSKQKNVRYENCRLNEADIYTCKLKKVDFSECELSGINFTGTPLKAIDISSCRFERISVTLEDLKGAIVSEEQALDFVVMLGLVIKK
jgi:uncharacterized protein YjbI with pentapeptide repeats